MIVGAAIIHKEHCCVGNGSGDCKDEVRLMSY